MQLPNGTTLSELNRLKASFVSMQKSALEKLKPVEEQRERLLDECERCETMIKTMSSIQQEWFDYNRDRIIPE